MKFEFWSVGKDSDAYIDEGVQAYTKRVSNYYPVSWKIIPLPRHAGLLTAPGLKSKEADSILKMLEPSDYLVALDEFGKMMSSPQLADFIQARGNESVKRLIFLIGGAYGLDAAVLNRAASRWSLSPLTFPHQLVRLILAEQVYRACSILRNEKYHHS